MNLVLGGSSNNQEAKFPKYLGFAGDITSSLLGRYSLCSRVIHLDVLGRLERKSVTDLMLTDWLWFYDDFMGLFLAIDQGAWLSNHK